MIFKAADPNVSTYEWVKANFTATPLDILCDDFLDECTVIVGAQCGYCKGTSKTICSDCEGKAVGDNCDEGYDCFDGFVPCEKCNDDEDGVATKLHNYYSGGDSDEWIYRLDVLTEPTAELKRLCSQHQFMLVSRPHNYHIPNSTSLYGGNTSHRVTHYYMVPVPRVKQVTWDPEHECRSILKYLGGPVGHTLFWVPFRAQIARDLCAKNGWKAQWLAVRETLVGEMQVHAEPHLATFVASVGGELPAPKKVVVKKKVAKKKVTKKVAKKKATKTVFKDYTWYDY